VLVLQYNNALKINWQHAANALHYELYRNNALLDTVTTATYTDTDLTNGVNYCYKVKAVYESCVSGFSEETCRKYSSTGISDYKSENENYVIYPNPPMGELTVEIIELEISTIEIVDITGKRVKNCSFVNNTINVSELPSGMYFMVLYSEGQKIVRKFVKQ
jgi:hypothetical protein